MPTSILDILPPTHLANPIALGIHAIHYILLAPILAGHESGSVLTGKVKGRWDRFEDDSITRGRSLAGLWTVSIEHNLIEGKEPTRRVLDSRSY